MSFVPYVVEQSAHGERSYDIFSRLLNDRIIVLSEDVNKHTVSQNNQLAANLHQFFQVMGNKQVGQIFLLLMNAWCLRLFTSMVGQFLSNPLAL